MTESCMYCHTPCQEGQKLLQNNMHKACEAVIDDRARRQVCIVCGNRPSDKELPNECRECYGVKDYAGVPAP